MAIYSLANLTTGVTNATPGLELRSASTGRLKVLEIGIWINAATATTQGIGRPAAIGITPTSPINGQAEDAGDVSTGAGNTALAWGTAPTVPAQFFRRINFPGTVGAGVIVTFPRGLVVPISNSIVLWNLVTGSALNTHLVWDE